MWQSWYVVIPLGHRRRIGHRACSTKKLRQLGSVVIAKANQHQVPAGGALAVDRGVFSQDLTATLETPSPGGAAPGGGAADSRQSGIVVLTTGPLTSEALSTDSAAVYGAGLHELFSTPPAPLWWATPLTGMSRLWASPLRPGGSGPLFYLKLPHEPVSKYLHFWTELCQAEQAELKDFERENRQIF